HRRGVGRGCAVGLWGKNYAAGEDCGRREYRARAEPVRARPPPDQIRPRSAGPEVTTPWSRCWVRTAYRWLLTIPRTTNAANTMLRTIITVGSSRSFLAGSERHRCSARRVADPSGTCMRFL